MELNSAFPCQSEVTGWARSSWSKWDPIKLQGTTKVEVGIGKENSPKLVDKLMLRHSVASIFVWRRMIYCMGGCGANPGGGGGLLLICMLK